MTKIDIFSGFLGAGKTTLIKKLIREAYAGEQLVLIENEFGEIGIDGGFMKQAGITVNEMNSGCICCSLVGDFTQALGQVLDQYHPDRILIEPSGVGMLSDVIKAAQKAESDVVKLNAFTTVIDARKCRVYARSFGEFYRDQIQHAGCVVLSRTDGLSREALAQAVELVRQHNPHATVVTTPWDELTGAAILASMEQRNTLGEQLKTMGEETCPVCGHDHDHEHHHHEHHHDGDECHCHDHGHHHHHDCDEHHHHHHHADEVFDSWGVETTARFTQPQLAAVLAQLADEHRFGTVLRAKGIVTGEDGNWIHFDYVPDAPDVRAGCADVTGRLCVIGAGLKKDAIARLFLGEEEAR